MQRSIAHAQLPIARGIPRIAGAPSSVRRGSEAPGRAVGRRAGCLVAQSSPAATAAPPWRVGGGGLTRPSTRIEEILQAEHVPAAGSPDFFGIDLLLCRNGVQTAS